LAAKSATSTAAEATPTGQRCLTGQTSFTTSTKARLATKARLRAYTGSATAT